jgi:hypothetical protein
MNLLYCQNGVVVATHDDQAAPVPASVYGDGVRIIPYDQPLLTLAKVGDPPAARERDMRPFAEPDPTPAILTGYSSQVRFDTVTAGITWQDIPVKTDRISQLLIANLATFAATLAPADNVDFTQDSVAYQFQAREAEDLNNQVNAFVQQCRTTESACLADLSSGSPTIQTYDDVDAKFATLKAKTLRAKKAK